MQFDKGCLYISDISRNEAGLRGSCLSTNRHVHELHFPPTQRFYHSLGVKDKLEAEPHTVNRE